MLSFLLYMPLLCSPIRPRGQHQRLSCVLRLLEDIWLSEYAKPETWIAVLQKPFFLKHIPETCIYLFV